MFESQVFDSNNSIKKIGDYSVNEIYNIFTKNESSLIQFTHILDMILFIKRDSENKNSDSVLYYSTTGIYRRRMVNLCVENFCKTYSSKFLRDALIIFKEEILKDQYAADKSWIDEREDINEFLYKLSMTIAASSYFKFSTIPNPSDFGFPEGLTSKEYYELLLCLLNNNKTSDNPMQPDSSNNSESEDKTDDEESNENDEDSDNKDDDEEDSDDADNDDNSDEDSNEDSDENGEDSDEDSDEDDEDSDEDNENSDEDDEDSDEDDKDSDENDEESIEDDKDGDGDADDDEESESDLDFTKDDIINILVMKGITDIETFISSVESTSTEIHPVQNLDLFNYKECDPKIKSFIERVKKEVVNSENVTTIVKSTKEKSFRKYSWKNDAYKSSGILYPGKRRTNGGVQKKFGESPVIFIDFSQSTSDINAALNLISYDLFNNDYTICPYCHHLMGSYNSENPSLFGFMSNGGTNTLHAVCSHFTKKYGENFEQTHPEVLDSHIYVITDGDENHYSLFKKFPNTCIYQIKQCISKSYYHYYKHYEFSKKTAYKDSGGYLYINTVSL